MPATRMRSTHGCGQKCADASAAIERADQSHWPAIQYMRIDLCGGHISMSEQFLHGANAGARFEQVRGEAMPQGMARSRPGNAGQP